MKQIDQDVATLEPTPPAAPWTGEVTIATFMAAADRLWAKVATALKVAGLTYPKYDVLKQLKQANGALSLRILAECKGCAASNITQIVDRLEAEGFVRRVDDPEDRRSVRAEMTDQGAAALEEGEIQLDVLRAQYRAAFTSAERAELGRLLAKI